MSQDFSNRPLRVLQYGEGNFLRSFADLMIQNANEAGDFSGSVAVIKPRGDAPLEQFARQSNRYTVAIQGIDDTGVVEQDCPVTCLSYALNPNLEPALYDELCLSPTLRFVISNTTEAGIRYDSGDCYDPVPKTYPGRVARLLHRRFSHFQGDASKGLYLIPCELIDNGGQALHDCVLQYAHLWGLGEDFIAWMEENCFFLNTLVDRIVSGFPKDTSAEHFARLGYEDALLSVCEPFALWAIEEKGNIREEFPIHKANPGVLYVPDVTPYKKRKVRLLNGAHTAMTPLALLSGKTFVAEAMADPLLRPFFDGLFDEEIIPAFTGLPKAELEQFARDVAIRFENPFLGHRWEAISLNSFSKFVARLMPTVRDCATVPQRIALAFAALVRLYCLTQRNDDPEVLAFFEECKSLAPQTLVDRLLKTPCFQLQELVGTEFAKAAIFWLEQLENHGVAACVGAFSGLIHIHSKDNVAVAKRLLTAGSPVVFHGKLLRVKTDIPVGHKVALTPIPKGETICKYGCSIGLATEDIAPGSHVHSHNLRSALTGKEEFTYQPKASTNGTEDAPTFQGFLRPDGKVGIRNDIWIIPTVGCINGTAQRLAQIAAAEKPQWIDSVQALTHPYGCSQLGEDHAATRQILADLASHPNAGGVLLLGLGCENNQLADLLPLVDHPNVKTLICQESDDEFAEGLDLIRELMENANAERQPIGADKLIIGIKCGGSDGFSGITANPLVGRLSDRLCAFGGSVVMGEVPEMFGAEGSLFPRCESKEVFHSALSMINDFKDFYLSMGLPVCENPSPGNRAGGITTLEEKSLGCTQKSGLWPIVDALPYGATHRKSGVTLLSTPGNDLVASTALAAAGCHMVLFTTGRGTPFGTCVPTVKISTNSALAQKKSGWIDFDAGALLDKQTMDSLTPQLLSFVLAVAGGQAAKNEANNCREITIFKTGATL